MKKLLLLICVLIPFTVSAHNIFDTVTEYDDEVIITNFCVEVLPQLEVRIARNPAGEETITPPIVFNAMRDCDALGWLRPFIGASIGNDIKLILFADNPKIPKPIVVHPYIPNVDRPVVNIENITVKYMFAALNIDVAVQGPGRVEVPGFSPLLGNFPVGIAPNAHMFGGIMPLGIASLPMFDFVPIGINGFININ